MFEVSPIIIGMKKSSLLLVKCVIMGSMVHFLDKVSIVVILQLVGACERVEDMGISE
jgi:hypothetical protein